MNLLSSVSNTQHDHPDQKILESLALSQKALAQSQEALALSQKENALQQELIAKLQAQDVQQQEQITQLQEQVEVPEADIRRLRKLPPKPDIKPNTRSPDDSDDSPGARHQEQNGVCTIICNELFAWNATTNSKSRENFLSLLHRPFRAYTLTKNALDYLRLKYPQKWLRVLQQYVGVTFLSHDAWKACMIDRLSGTGLFPRLGEVIEKASSVLPCGLSKVIV